MHATCICIYLPTYPDSLSMVTSICMRFSSQHIFDQRQKQFLQKRCQVAHKDPCMILRTSTGFSKAASASRCHKCRSPGQPPAERDSCLPPCKLHITEPRGDNMACASKQHTIRCPIAGRMNQPTQWVWLEGSAWAWRLVATRGPHMLR
jgi:hypothetical protein